MALFRYLRKFSLPIYWRFQIIGWICFDAVYVPIFQPQYLESWERFRFVFLNMGYGIILTGLMRLVYVRIQRRKTNPAALALAMFFTSLIGAVIWMTTDYLISGLILAFSGKPLDWGAVQFVIATDTTILFGWSLLYFALKLYLDWNAEKKRAEAAIQLSRDAQMQLLRYQLNPHFLFNSLNSIRTLMDEDVTIAKQTITELADFFRYSLVNRDVLFVPLRDEIEAVRLYFAIQRIRYEESLHTDISVSPEAEAFPVLSFMVHPLIENAVKYGMQTSDMPLRISLSAEVAGDTLRLAVTNSGSWVEPNPSSRNGTGTGLGNIRKLLENAYPSAHRFEITPTQGCVHVQVTITRPPETR
jgi:LytS/YehU family sensor histidine kinase